MSQGDGSLVFPPPPPSFEGACPECGSADPFHCPVCHGVGFVETPPVVCAKCHGNPRGCYQCRGGYVQAAWTECAWCFLYGD